MSHCFSSWNFLLNVYILFIPCSTKFSSTNEILLSELADLFNMINHAKILNVGLYENEKRETSIQILYKARIYKY